MTKVDEYTPLIFHPFPSIPRGKNMEVTITEKLDGCNVGIHIDENLKFSGAQSRKRMLDATKKGDQNGFYKWCLEQDDLGDLGYGIHYGEWHGEGIRKNPQKIVGKKLSLFNTFKDRATLPKNVDLVPILFQGTFHTDLIDIVMSHLKQQGIAQGYSPEGIVIYYHWLRAYQKETFANPDGKWSV